MAVQIPQLQAVNPSPAMPQNERIDMRVSDHAQEILSRTGAVGDVAAKATDIYNKFEDQQITNLSYKAEKDYTAWYDENLQKIKRSEDDPTKLYAEFETQAKEKRDSIIASTGDASERVKSHFEANLGKTDENLRVQMMKQRGAHQETYNNNMYESALKLKKDNLAVNAGYIQKDDPGSYLMFDENIADIRTAIAKKSLEKGSATQLPPDAKTWDYAYKNEDNQIVKVKLADNAKVRTAKELSEGVQASITSMIASGYNEEAKQAYEKYQGYIDPKNQLTLKNKFKDSDTKDAAYEYIGQMQGKSEEQQMALIAKIDDPEIKSQVIKIKDTDDTRLQHMRDRKAKANFQVLANKVINKQNSENPYNGIAELEDDPLYKGTWDNIDPHGKKAIMEMVKAPNETNPKAEARIQNLFFGNDPNNKIEDIAPEEFQKYTVGLNKPDKTKYTNMYNRQHTQTASQERSVYKQAGQILQDQFLIDGHIERDKYGKISGDDEITLLKAKNKLIDTLDAYGGQMDQKQLQEFVKKFSAAEVKGKVWSPEPKSVYKSQPNSVTGTTSAVANPATKNDIVLSAQQLVQLKKKYKDTYGSFPKTDDPKFKTFVQNNK